MWFFSFMLKCSAVLYLQPRNINHTPPPLITKPGHFVCKLCKAKWWSNNVLLTALTHKVYQGQTCRECGTTNRPRYIGKFSGDIYKGLNPSPHGHHIKRSNKSMGHLNIRIGNRW